MSKYGRHVGAVPTCLKLPFAMHIPVFNAKPLNTGIGGWWVALGTWHLALGTWHLALGTWRLALGLSQPSYVSTNATDTSICRIPHGNRLPKVYSLFGSP